MDGRLLFFEDDVAGGATLAAALHLLELPSIYLHKSEYLVLGAEGNTTAFS
jgi:hypothetical protein